MNWQSLPWTEMTIALPLTGAAAVALARDRDVAWRWSVGVALAALVTSLLAFLAFATGGESWDPFAALGRPLFAVDGLSAPLLPLAALLTFLTVLSAPRSEGTRSTFACLLAGEALQLAAFASTDAWLLGTLLSIRTLPPLLVLLVQGKSIRVYALHVGLYVVLLLGGVATLGSMNVVASILLMLAVLVRSGTIPAHLWVSDLFEHAPFGSALLFFAPLPAVYTALRLLLPIAPDWVLQGIGVASLITACYSAGMAVVQRDARRMLAYLFLSNASLVLVGLELHTAVSLTGALSLWISVALSLGGMGITLRALEARFEGLTLDRYHGLYGQSPALAVCFLLTGLASVGFPGTLGFIATELLADGAIQALPLVGVALILAAAVNGIAVLRAYLLLFTGTRREFSVPLAITLRERFAVLVLSGLILGGGLMPQPGIADRHAVAGAILSERAGRQGRREAQGLTEASTARINWPGF